MIKGEKGEWMRTTREKVQIAVPNETARVCGIFLPYSEHLYIRMPGLALDLFKLHSEQALVDAKDRRYDGRNREILFY